MLLNIFTKSKRNTDKKMPEKQYISWEEFHQDVKDLAKKIKENGDFNRIIAISRGGLIPAGILAYELNIRLVDSISICSYDGSYEREDCDIEVKNAFSGVDEHTLVVDDLSDSGRTCRLINRHYPSAFFAAVYAKPRGKDAPDIYGKALSDKWVVFPWD